MFAKFLRHIRAHFRRIPCPQYVPPFARRLTDEDRQAVRDWLNLPTAQLALSVLSAQHPGCGIPRSFARSEWDERAAVNHLHFVAGWERCLSQLSTLARAETEPVTTLEETYPDEE
jgi:hypothetical protein